MTLVKLGIGAYKERFLENWDFCLNNFDVLELQDFIMPDQLDNPKIIDEYLGMLSGFKGEVTVHGPYLNLVPTSIDKKVRGVAEYRYLQAVDAAVKLGARQLVIHSFYDTTTGYAKYDELWFEENVRFWNAFLPKIMDSGVTILLENVYDKLPDTFAKCLEVVDSPHFSSCVDIGHCNCMSSYKPELWISRVKGHYFHINDNDGTRDGHLVPGKGDIDFYHVSKELAGLQLVYLIGEMWDGFADQFESLQKLREMIIAQNQITVR
ncbi:MAG: sugar phosphate isomerase/epimerase family protein [Thermacetogeniaceae bacterium]|jgi:sugar phosphate isomerase/epimerase|nr:sugar phosphate isomerase/epimerase [Syntrophomonadaceae bacterium]